MPISVSQWHNLLGKLFAELNGKKKPPYNSSYYKTEQSANPAEFL